MIRLLILALLGFLVYTLFAALFRALPGRGRSGPSPEKTRRGEDMVQDPQCGTFIPRGEALEKRIGGKTHHFCSKECLERFSDRM